MEFSFTMTQNKAIGNVREFVSNGLRMKTTTRSNDRHTRAAAFALQNAISQITDEHIEFLITNPNARLRISKLKG